ncbi:hypothetical protein P154DRAFT_586319 [Amniculicola lignicola CBS 123094]|uniref:Uncharacterized protein n=1 Tax=Amniculicola lignicola CBS 123094 TaxID=1392246 RepID=A0A6A5WUS8_9PLEO|nr:hypothetical protein P154DRAFT_586319 [Amniculicola lignicola CBS 123094]
MSTYDGSLSKLPNLATSRVGTPSFPRLTAISPSASRTESPSLSGNHPSASSARPSPSKPTTPNRSKRLDPYAGTPRGRRSGRLASKPRINFSDFPKRRRDSPTLSELVADLSSAPSDLLTPTPERTPSPSEIELQRKARAYVKPKPVYLPAPRLPKDRLKIDAMNVGVFAEDGAKDLWKSAMSFERFGGPRRMAPFRELHGLTDPPHADFSDWAENVRWAKEQFVAFGSVWVENGYDLERITEWRRENHWVSDGVMSG